MNIFAKLGLGFATMVLTFAAVGGLTLSYLHALQDAEAGVRARVAQNEVALAYRHGAQDASLGATQLATGNVIGEQRIAEGLVQMAESRRLLATRLRAPSELRELRELERIERLTAAATLRVMELVRSHAAPELVRQELAFLSARADALNLRLEALSDDTREQMVLTMAHSAVLVQRVQTHTGMALGACLVLSLIVSAVVFRAIAPPLARLAEGVRSIAKGNLDYRIKVDSHDEIGRLTRAFNDMTSGLKQAMGALDARNQDMRVVLDHVDQGLFTMERDGRVSRERSRMVDAWLGEIAEGTTFWDHVGTLDPAFAASFSLNWAQVLDGFLPVELTLDQMPRRFQGRGVALEAEYTPIFEGETVSKLLVVITDIGDRLARERARAHEQEVFAIFQAIQRDKQGFVDFFAEGSELVSALARHEAQDLVLTKRQVHTLKGNSAIFGICSVAQSCHALETHMEESAAGPEGAELEALRSRWSELEAVVARLVGDQAARIEIDDDEYASILTAILEGRPRRDIAQLLSQWRMERVQPRLERFAEQARALGQKLDKSLETRVQVALPRLPREAFAPFWSSLVHALRNAVDHGLETADERERAGKSGLGTLVLRSAVDGDMLAIEVEDDGRGIDWDKIAEKARARGMPAENHEDLVQALFSDGVSTAEAVTDVSGRGVGMAALRDACHGLGGQISIRSVAGKGTCMSFRFPLSLLFSDTPLGELPANRNTVVPRATPGASALGA